MLSDCSTISLAMRPLLNARLFVEQEKGNATLSIRLEIYDVIMQLFYAKNKLKKITNRQWKKFLQSLFFYTVEALLHDLHIDEGALLALLAHAYRYGYCSPRNPEAAFDILNRAYESGSRSPVLLRELSNYYLNGIGTEVDIGMAQLINREIDDLQLDFVDEEDDDNRVPAATVRELPSPQFEGLWDK